LTSGWDPASRIAGFVPNITIAENSALSHGNGQSGTVYAYSPWDSPPSNLRGNAVAVFAEPLSKGEPALPYPFEWFDNRVNSGKNETWNDHFAQNKKDMIGYFQGIGNPVTFLKSNVVLRGAISDNITSYGGRIGQHYTQEGVLSWVDVRARREKSDREVCRRKNCTALVVFGSMCCRCVQSFSSSTG
jgi:hypothetical protein